MNPYPLQWPLNWTRTPPTRRKDAKFATIHYGESKKQITIAAACVRVNEELRRMGALERDVVITSDLRYKVDGSPYSNQAGPIDPGVAVYWKIDGDQQFMAIDIYNRIADNIAAVAATLDAMRAIERHGGATIMKRAWQGFKALTSSTLPVYTTHQVAEKLATISGFPAQVQAILNDPDQARELLRIAKSRTHPDANKGNEADWLLVQEVERILKAHHGGKL